jgi:hypothetical protein
LATVAVASGDPIPQPSDKALKALEAQGARFVLVIAVFLYNETKLKDS